MHATQTTIPNILPLNENLLGYNVGGGAVGFITRHTGVRFDLRYYSSLSRNENSPAFGPAQLRYWTGAVGVVFSIRPGGFAPPDPPSPSLAGTPSPRSAPAPDSSLRSTTHPGGFAPPGRA